MAISLGDFTAIALSAITVSLHCRCLSTIRHYQSDAAAVTAMVLLLFYFFIFYLRNRIDPMITLKQVHYAYPPMPMYFDLQLNRAEKLP